MNDINALRDALFDTLRGLRDKEKPLDIERAKAINETAQTIINSAKVEVDFCRVTGTSAGSGFIPAAIPAAPGQGEKGHLTATGVKTTTQIPGGSVTTHRIR